MKKVKFILITALVLLLAQGTFVLAKDKEDKKDRENEHHKDVTELIEDAINALPLGTSTPATSTPQTPEQTATTTSTEPEPVATTTTPGAPNAGGVATSSVEATVVTPPKPKQPGFLSNIFNPNPKTNSTTTSTSTPAMIMSTAAGNTTLGDGFFTSNYYGPTGFSDGATFSLKIAGFLSAVSGVFLLAYNRMLAPRVRVRS